MRTVTMLQFLAPAGWLALAALALPVVLHLWRPPARTVRLGSVRFLEGLPRRNLRNLRWREPLLLLARLLLLALLVLLLTGPVWMDRRPRVPQRWVLVSPDVSVESIARDRLRALRSGGYGFHRFAAGFPLFEGAVSQSVEPPDAWSLLRELDAALPRDSQVVVFTRGRVADLRGPRPALQNCRVEWVQTPASDTLEHPWIQDVHATGSGDTAHLNFSLGLSNAAATRFVSQKVPARLGRTPLDGRAGKRDLEVRDAGNGEFAARLVASDGEPAGDWMISRRSTPVGVLILHDPDRSEDARYVEAAVRAAVQADERELILKSETTDRPVEEDRHDQYIFWLSRQTVPESINRLIIGGGRLVDDAPGQDVTTGDGSMVVPDGVTRPILPPGTVAIKRRAAAPPGERTTLWTDGFGDPLLTSSRIGRGERLSFLSRFHPAWNDLARTGALAEVVRSWLMVPPPVTAAGSRDRRMAGANQGSPTVAEDTNAGPLRTQLGISRYDLRPPLWAVALLCFCAERFLSHRPTARS